MSSNVTNFEEIIGSDWNIFLSLEKEDGTFQDLNGYSYSVKIADQDKTVLLTLSGVINTPGEEVIVRAPGSTTENWNEGSFFLELKFVAPGGEVDIFPPQKFRAVQSLHAQT